MKQKALPKRTVLLWQLRVVMLTAILIGVCYYFSNSLPFLNWVAVFFGLLCLVVIAFYIPAFFGAYEIFIKNDALIINYGVFIKVSHIMPYARLIYAQTFATPIARLFGLTMISLKAVRSRVIVPEIKLENAIKIINHLADKGENDENL